MPAPKSLPAANDALFARLAQLDEQFQGGQRPDAADATVANLKTELDTLVAELRRPSEPRPYENESACQKVTQMVQAIGRDPDELSEQTLDRPEVDSADTNKPSGTAETPLGSLGVYELMTKLGEGGMGAVYKARHTKLDKVVAIKVLPAERMKDQGAVARFEREMRAVGKLEHPNIVRAMDAGEAAGMHFLVMEYVQGADLSQLVKQCGPLPVADACELIRQAAIGLEEAREHGMVHRDIKPSNIMLCVVSKKKPPVVKVLDMGLALLSEAYSPDARGLTTTGQMMGTLDYMAPEQGGDSHDVDIRADIYSLGASLYKLLCGQVIYHGEKFQTPVQKMMALATLPAPPIQKRRKGIPNELAAVLHRMLEKDPAKRFATPEQVAIALAPFCKGANLAKLLAAAGFDIAPSKDASATESSFSKSDVDTGVPKDRPAGAPAIPAAKPPVARAEKTNPSLAKPPAPKSTAAPARVDKPPVPPARVDAPQSVPAKSQVVPHISVRPAKKPAAVRRKLPPWAPIAIGGGLLGLGGIAALVAAIVFYFQTPNGTLRVEINDPSVEVTVKGSDIILKKAEKEEITLTPGEHTLIVKRGDFQFETDKLVLKKGETTTVSVELLAGEVKVVDGDRVIGKTSVLPATPNNAPSTSGYALQFQDGSLVTLPSLPFDPVGLMTLEAWVTPAVEDLKNTVPIFAASETFGLCINASGNWDFRAKWGASGNKQPGGYYIYASGHGPVTRTKRYHLAGVRSGKQFLLFVDGRLVGTKEVPLDALDKLTTPWMIGGQFKGVHFHGTIDEVRYSKVARYEEDFTPADRFERDADTLALYHFDEGQGEVLRDSSGNNHHGKITGAKWLQANPPTAAGIDGYALQFNVGAKSPDFHDVVVPTLKDEENLTMEFWMQRDASKILPNSLIMGFGRHQVQVTTNAPTQLAIAWNVAVPGDQVDPREAQEFFHVAAVRDATKKEVRLFVRGKLVGRHKYDAWELGGHLEICSRTFQWKGEQDTTDYNFVGMIDETRISNTARYDADFTPQRRFEADEHTQALYHFDEGQGDVLADSSGNNHHGKITGAKWVQSGSAESAASVLGDRSALEFARSEIGVTVPTLLFEPLRASPLTLETWVRRDRTQLGNMGIVSFPGCFSIQASAGGVLPIDFRWHHGFLAAEVESAEAAETWSHYAAVRDMDKGEYRFYLNGKLAGKKEINRESLEPDGKASLGFARQFTGRIGQTRLSAVARYDAEFAPPQGYEPDDKTIALYKFDEGAGDVLRDSSGNNHHGKIIGAKWVKGDGTSPSEQAAVAWPALQFSGTKSYAELPLTLADAKNPLTVEVWLLHEDKDWRISLRAGENTLQLKRSPIGQLAWMVVDAEGKSSGIKGDLTLATGDHAHIAATIDGDQMKIFVNGKPLATAPGRGGMPNLAKLPSFIGWAMPTDFGKSDPAGTINGVRISKAVRYREAFNPAQQWTTDADTLALYRCDEGQGDVLRDSSGNNHDGKIVGAKWVKFDATPAPDSVGFVPLFNGQDLTGWDAKRSASIDWKNEGGTITGRNRSASVNSAGVLQSQKGYRDFHFRCEMLAGSGAEPALLFRSGGRLVRGERHGYALTNPVPTSPSIAEGWGYGSLYADDFQVPPPQCRLAPAAEKDLGIKTGDWYRLEIIAQGEVIEIRVNGRQTVRHASSDPALNRAGSFSLRCHAGTTVAFRNVEIKELPASSAN